MPVEERGKVEHTETFGSWAVSVQVRLWFNDIVEAESEDQAVRIVAERARSTFGDDAFVYPEGAESASL